MARIVDTGKANTVVTLRQNTVASIREVVKPVKVSSPGVQGPEGPQGPPGPSGGGTVNKTAAQAIGGHRIVRSINATEVDYASNTNEAHGDDVLGMTFGAAAAGDELAVITANEVTEPSWNWTPLEPLFLADNGLITQTPPSPDDGAMFSLVVGVATGPTTVRISIEAPIYF